MSQPAPGPSQELAALKSLAPQYDEAQHKTYVKRLQTALEDPRNRNIALSGPYGTGKSSVLDKFQEEHEDSTLRLAISTLAPDAEGATLTNRIQKEVLKQLVYSARPSTLRHSRFSRRGPLSWWRAAGESAAAVGVLGALLALLGRLPSQVATGSGHSTTQRAVVWAMVAALLIVTGAVLRKVTYRFVVSDVSAAGATLKLSEEGNTYFDEHLDEILYFFDQESKDIVIFEDLDRYNDPQIFQALRELNTLLNNTPKRRDKIAKDQTPLRFVYAMRDSLFEKIGEDTAEIADDDAARAENIRANRTKFFEVVIPVVPFISHRTAREHLHQLLREAGITGVDRVLMELVAKHATDMRLLVNMRNEYLVFAERLLKSDKVAPDLSASHLFALIAYKNFHLQDFENIARRASDLDRLYDYHRELVATSVADREQAKRNLLSRNARPQAIGPFAKRLAQRLQAIGTFERDRNPGWSNMLVRFTVEDERYDVDQAGTPEFWDAADRSRSVALGAVSGPRGTGALSDLGTMDQEHLESLFPEVLKGRWDERDAEAVQEELRELSREVDLLRGADFRDLAATDQFKLSVPVTDEGAVAPEDSRSVERTGLTFGELVDKTLKSDLARDLVRRGYIDRNFTLYAAQFYDDFTGLDVATFTMKIVQNNSIDINYQFTSAGALKNLLAEAGDDFTRTVSAYNIQLVDYLLIEHPDRASEVVEHLTSGFGNDQKSFLAAFFTSAEHRTELAAQLSRKPWPAVFTYLVADEGVPTDVRTQLVDAALLAAVPTGAYDLGPEVADFLVAHYTEMPAFTEAHPTAELEAVLAMLRRAEVLLPTPAGVQDELRTLIVENNLYELTADSLRAALGATGAVTLDEVQANAAVYAYCLENLDTYLDAVDADSDTEYSVRSPETLVRALEAAEEDERALERLTATASPDSSLRLLTAAPTSAWPALAAAKLFRASVANLEAYRAQVGDIDEHLGALLVSAGVIDPVDDAAEGAHDEAQSEEPDHAAAAVALLNASRGIPSPEDRVRLAASLSLSGPLQGTQISPEGSELFALLIEQELLPDEASTFAHLRAGGPAAVMPAIVSSAKVQEFLTPELVSGMVAALFSTPDVSAKVGRRVLDDLAEFVPSDEADPLAAAAKFAIQSGTALPVEQIHRVARTCRDAALTVRLLALAAPAGSEVAAVLTDLGGKYSYVSTWEQTEFEVPDDEPHNAVFKILVEANMCRSTKKRGKPFLVIKRP